jgi:hypothetical protein
MSKFLNVMEEARQTRALFLALIVVLNAASVYCFAYFGLILGIEGKVFTLIIAILNGFLAWFFMHESSKFQIFIYSIFFTYLSYFLYHYLIFIHYYHWESNLLWDKSTLDNTLMLKYISSIGKYTLKGFFNYFTKTDSPFTYIYLSLHILPLFLYKILAEFRFQTEVEDTDQVKRIIKRRFK